MVLGSSSGGRSHPEDVLDSCEDEEARCNHEGKNDCMNGAIKHHAEESAAIWGINS